MSFYLLFFFQHFINYIIDEDNKLQLWWIFVKCLQHLWVLKLTQLQPPRHLHLLLFVFHVLLVVVSVLFSCCLCVFAAEASQFVHRDAWWAAVCQLQLTHAEEGEEEEKAAKERSEELTERVRGDDAASSLRQVKLSSSLRFSTCFNQMLNIVQLRLSFFIFQNVCSFSWFYVTEKLNIRLCCRWWTFPLFADVL